MPKIFISYARADATQLADELADRLRSMEYDVFLDKHSIVGSTEWEKVIKERVGWCELMVILVTPASNQSQWVFREFEFAKGRKKNILPVMVNQATLPVHLLKYHAVEYANNLDSVLLQIARIVPPPQNNGGGFSCQRLLSFGVITTIIALLLAFLALIPDSQRELWFCWINNTCPTEIATLPTNTPEPTISNEPPPILPTSTPSLTPLPPTPIPTNTIEPTPTPVPIYEEDFEDGIAQDWVLLGGWGIRESITETNRLLYSSGNTEGYSRVIYPPSEIWGDVAIEFRVVVPTYLHIYFCERTSTQNYLLNIDRQAGFISFYDYAVSQSEPSKETITLLAGDWYDVRIEIQGNEVTATVDGTTLAAFSAENCSYGREFTFGTEYLALIDDIRVWSLDGDE